MMVAAFTLNLDQLCTPKKANIIYDERQPSKNDRKKGLISTNQGNIASQARKKG